jgi:hypothetical protein
LGKPNYSKKSTADECHVATQFTEAKAAMGLALIKEAILDYLHNHPNGLRNAEIARDLTLESDHEGKQKDYLTYSILGILLKERRVRKIRTGSRTLYSLTA